MALVVSGVATAGAWAGADGALGWGVLRVTGGRGPPSLLLLGFLRWRLLAPSSGRRKGDVGSDPGACGGGGALAVGSLGEQKRVPQVVRGT